MTEPTVSPATTQQSSDEPPTTAAGARADLHRAAALGAASRDSSAYLVTYFRAWAVGSLVMGAACFLFPLVRHPAYILACFVAWLAFIGALVVFYYRGRRTRPRNSPAMFLGVFGGTFPWAFAGMFGGRLAATAQAWWLAGLPWLVAGLITGALLIGAAELAERELR